MKQSDHTLQKDRLTRAASSKDGNNPPFFNVKVNTRQYMVIAEALAQSANSDKRRLRVSSLG
jgi:hypothetical protein